MSAPDRSACNDRCYGEPCVHVTNRPPLDLLVDEVVDTVLAHQGQGAGGPHDAVRALLAPRGEVSSEEQWRVVWGDEDGDPDDRATRSSMERALERASKRHDDRVQHRTVTRIVGPWADHEYEEQG